MAGREEYLLELIAGEYQKQLIDDTDAHTGLKSRAIQIRDDGSVFSVLKVNGVDALSGTFGNLDNSTNLSVTDGVLFAGKDKFFTDITLTSGSIWTIESKDA